ncbi:MAG: hypothetical protein ACP5NY_02675 [Thermocladium sp.]
MHLGVSEIIGAVMLVLIAAVLGLFVLGYANRLLSVSSPQYQCSVSIPLAVYNVSGSSVSGMIIYVYDAGPYSCQLGSAYIINQTTNAVLAQLIIPRTQVKVGQIVKLVYGKVSKSSAYVDNVTSSATIPVPSVVSIYTVTGSEAQYPLQ